MYIQGDLSGCSLGFVDIKTMVALKYKVHILQRNLCFDISLNGHPVQGDHSACSKRPVDIDLKVVF